MAKQGSGSKKKNKSTPAFQLDLKKLRFSLQDMHKKVQYIKEHQRRLCNMAKSKEVHATSQLKIACCGLKLILVYQETS